MSTFSVKRTLFRPTTTQRIWTTHIPPSSLPTSARRRFHAPPCAEAYDTSDMIPGIDFPFPDDLPPAKSAWRNYETILCIRGSISEEERDVELARLESFLLSRGAEFINVNVRGPYTLAYTMNKDDTGSYALFTYTVKRSVMKEVEYLLSHPEVGTEDFILRYKTFVRK